MESKLNLSQIQALQLLPPSQGWAESGIQHPQSSGKVQICIQTLQLGFIPSQQQQNKQTDAEEAAETKQQQKRHFWYQVGVDFHFLCGFRAWQEDCREASAVTACLGPLCTGLEARWTCRLSSLAAEPLQAQGLLFSH